MTNWTQGPKRLSGGIPMAISREFHAAVENLLDWMNNNDLSWDHADQRPEEFARLCSALEEHEAAIAKATGAA